jgi:hypothetical protein
MPFGEIAIRAQYLEARRITVRLEPRVEVMSCFPPVGGTVVVDVVDLEELRLSDRATRTGATIPTIGGDRDVA